MMHAHAHGPPALNPDEMLCAALWASSDPAQPATHRRRAWPGCTRTGTLSTGTKGDEPYYCAPHFEDLINGR